jgi:hypothetical protein
MILDSSTCFVGPGRYNPQENFSKMDRRPCSSIMKRICAIPSSESGKPSYIMVGNQIKHEAAYLTTSKQRNELRSFGNTECPVSINATL